MVFKYMHMIHCVIFMAFSYVCLTRMVMQMKLSPAFHIEMIILIDIHHSKCIISRWFILNDVLRYICFTLIVFTLYIS